MLSWESRDPGTTAQCQRKRRGPPGPRLRDGPAAQPYSQQLLVGPLLVGLVADVGYVDGEVVGGVEVHDVAHV